MLNKLMTNEVNFKWTKIERVYGEINLIATRNTLLAYLGFNKQFKIDTNSSNFQLEAVISQEGRPINSYSINQPTTKLGIWLKLEDNFELYY